MRNKILNYALRRLCKNSKREKIYRNLQDIRTVLVVFDSAQLQAADAFIRQLSSMGKHVTGCSLRATHDTADYTQTPYVILSKKDFNWWGKISPEMQKNMQVVGFDTLIDLTMKENLELEYLVASLNIPLKIGLKKNSLAIYDLSISDNNMKQKLSVEELEVHLLHYLHAIH